MKKETLIGKWFGKDLVIKTDDPEIIETVKKKLSTILYIYFCDYPDGHHPDFYNNKKK